MKHVFKSHWFIRSTLLVLLAGLALHGCGGSESTPANANPTGYYDVTGTASVKADDNTTDLSISDLQGMVNGNRFIAMSAAEGLVYDGTLTIANVDTFTANISIYRDGALLTTATASGTITQGSSITGTLTGTGAGNGTFRLTYALSNSNPAALERVAVVGGGRQAINGPIVGHEYEVTISGDLVPFNTSGGAFDLCEMRGTFVPVAGVNVYTITVAVTNCSNAAINGSSYTGLASTRSDVIDNQLLTLVVSNGNYSLYGELETRL
jgi:hypothetical protein